ncbi:MAG: hypothetical protein ACYTX0_62795, partial [Nostoc sp.]
TTQTCLRLKLIAPNSSGTASLVFVVLESLTFPPLVRSPGSQDPNLSLATYTYKKRFSLVALMVKTK